MDQINFLWMNNHMQKYKVPFPSVFEFIYEFSPTIFNNPYYTLVYNATTTNCWWLCLKWLQAKLVMIIIITVIIVGHHWHLVIVRWEWLASPCVTAKISIVLRTYWHFQTKAGKKYIGFKIFWILLGVQPWKLRTKNSFKFKVYTISQEVSCNFSLF